MKPFPGFPDKAKYIPIPNAFFPLLTEIAAAAELKVILHLFRLLSQKRGYPRFVTLGEMLGDRLLLSSLGDSATATATLRRALEQVCQRGLLLPLIVTRNEAQHHLYFLNDSRGRDAIARIERGELPLGEVATEALPAATVAPSDIFSLYEQNIGVLTPLIVEELKEAERLYPSGWIAEAFREAVAHNKRRWSYIARILQRWEEEGKDSGKDQREPAPDTDKYLKGKYGRLVRR